MSDPNYQDTNAVLDHYFNTLIRAQSTNEVVRFNDLAFLFRLLDSKIKFFVDKNQGAHLKLTQRIKEMNLKYFEVDSENGRIVMGENNMPKLKEGMTQESYDKEMDEVMSLPLTIKF